MTYIKNFTFISSKLDYKFKIFNVTCIFSIGVLKWIKKKFKFAKVIWAFSNFKKILVNLNLYFFPFIYKSG